MMYIKHEKIDNDHRVMIVNTESSAFGTGGSGPSEFSNASTFGSGGSGPSSLNIMEQAQARLLKRVIEELRKDNILSKDYSITITPSATLLERVRAVHGNDAVETLKMMIEEIK